MLASWTFKYMWKSLDLPRSYMIQKVQDGRWIFKKCNNSLNFYKAYEFLKQPTLNAYQSTFLLGGVLTLAAL